MAWRHDPARTVDRLADGTALVSWAAFVGLVDDEQAAAFTASCTTTPAPAAGSPLRCAALASASTACSSPWRSARSRPERTWPRSTAGCWAPWLRAEVGTVMPLEWSTGLRSVSDLTDELALATWRLLQHEDRRRLRQCRDDDCGWLFLDRTKNGSRVWCSSADCGNRTRARRHYQRRTAAPR